MELRVKHKELKEVSKETIDNSKLLNEKITLLIGKIKELENNWQGEDADIFYNSILPYLYDLKSIPIFYAEISNIINKMNNDYESTDEDFLDTLKKGVVIDEEYYDKQ